MKKYIDMAVLQLKSLKLLTIVPLIVYYLILPVLNVAYFKKYGFESVESNAWAFALMFIPVISVFSPLLIVRDFSESNGSELLFVQNVNTPLYIYLIGSIFNFLSLVPLFGVYLIIFKAQQLQILHMMAVLLFLSGMLFLLWKITNSLAITFAIDIVYCAFCVATPIQYKDSPFGFLLYFNVLDITGDFLLTKSLPLLLLGLAAFIIARLSSKKLVRTK